MTRIHRIFFSGTQAKQHCNTCTNCLVCAGYDLIEWLMDRLCIEDSRKLLLTQHRAGVGSIYSINVCSSRGCPPGQPALPVRLLLPRQRAEEPPRQGWQLPLQVSGEQEARATIIIHVMGICFLSVFNQDHRSDVNGYLVVYFLQYHPNFVEQSIFNLYIKYFLKF